MDLKRAGGRGLEQDHTKNRSWGAMSNGVFEGGIWIFIGSVDGPSRLDSRALLGSSMGLGLRST